MSAAVTKDDFEGFLHPDDAMHIGLKLVEMADRVKAIDPAVPGAQATWTLDLDGSSFKVVISRVTHPTRSEDSR